MSTFHDGSADATSAAPDRPVDLVHLAKQTFGDKRLEQEVLGLFLTQAALLTDRLDRAATEAEWKIAAHTLKGSAQGVGAWRVARAAQAAERFAADRVSDAAVQARAALRAAVEEANATIHRLMAA